MQERSLVIPTASQLRAARALLGWPPSKVAGLAGLDVTVIRAAERYGAPEVEAEYLLSIRLVLSKAGVMFIDESGPSGGVGVRFAPIP